MTPETLTGEVRLGDPELRGYCRHVATCVERDQPVVMTFAAEGSAHPLLWVPRGAILPTREARYTFNDISANQPGSTFVVRGDSRAPSWGAIWLSPGFVDVGAVVDYLHPNRVDAVPLAIMLNLVEAERGTLGLEWLTAADAVDQLLGELAPRWLEWAKDDREGALDYGEYTVTPGEVLDRWRAWRPEQEVSEDSSTDGRQRD